MFRTILAAGAAVAAPTAAVAQVDAGDEIVLGTREQGYAADPAAPIRVLVDATGWGVGPERADSIIAMLERLDSL